MKTDLSAYRLDSAKARYLANINANRKSKATIADLFFIFSYCIAIAFDFKSETAGGNIIQVLCVCASCFSAVMLLPKLRISHCSPTLLRATYLWWIGLFLSVAIAIYWQIPFDRFIRIVLPYVLCGLSLIVTMVMCSIQLPIQDALQIIFLGGVISVITGMVYAITVLHVNLTQCRYEILGPGTGFVLAASISSLLFNESMSKNGFIIPVVISTLLSLTRTMLSGIILCVAASVLIIFKHKLVNRVVNSWVMGFLLISIGVVSAVTVRPDVIDAWYSRLNTVGSHGATINGYDITTATRIAEYRGQLRQLTKIDAILCGKGLGATYRWDMQFLPGFLETNRREDLDYWTPGHSLYVYSLFTGGILTGWIFPGVFLWALWLSLKSSFARQTRANLVKISAPVALMLIFQFACSFFMCPLYSRFIGFQLGMVMGMCFWNYDVILNSHNTPKMNKLAK